jgi:hypothetical protein
MDPAPDRSSPLGTADAGESASPTRLDAMSIAMLIQVTGMEELRLPRRVVVMPVIGRSLGG